MHRLPLDFGFDDPWPTSVDQYDGRRANVSVETWFGNKWLMSWRALALGATLARRVEWFIDHSADIGLPALTDSQADQLRTCCGQRVSFVSADVTRNGISRVWKIWEELAAGASLAAEWLDGRWASLTVTNELQPKVVARAMYKPCRAPGLHVGFYREQLGKICVASALIGIVRSLKSIHGIDAELFETFVPHARARHQACSEMATGTSCLSCWISRRATTSSKPTLQVYTPDAIDMRFRRHGDLEGNNQTRMVDTVVASRGSEAVGSVTALFLSVDDDSIADRCAHALGLLPSWCHLSALPQSEPMLTLAVQQAIDRRDIQRAAQSSLDHVYATSIVRGQVVAVTVVERPAWSKAVTAASWSKCAPRGVSSRSSPRWTYGHDLGSLRLTRPHSRAARMSCGEMVSRARCKDRYVADVAAARSIVTKPKYAPEARDPALAPIGEVRCDNVPQIDTVVSGLGSFPLGIVHAILLGIADDQLATPCAHARGLLPHWANMAALPASASLLAANVERVLDRESMSVAARPSSTACTPSSS